MRSVNKAASRFRPVVNACATVLAWTVCAGLLQPHRALAQGQEEAVPCPTGDAPALDWVKEATRPGPGVTNPTLVKSSKPEYTPEAKARGISGEVWLDARIDIDGQVRNVCVVRSQVPELDAEAVKAAKRFEFRPGHRAGVPVPVLVRIQIAFNPR